MILVVDDDKEVAIAHSEIITGLGHTALIECDPTRVDKVIKATPEIRVVLLDVRMPHLDGLEVLRRIKLVKPQVGVVMATVVNDIELAVHATKRGAYNYLLKPINSDRVEEVLTSLLNNHPTDYNNDPRFSQIITQSPLFDGVFKRVTAFAATDAPVLVSGETGTGKELIAQLIHTLSPRAGKSLTTVNVAALTSTIFEAELFGHEKGAFTSALASRPGYCEVAGSGTLFLDEIGELGLEEQKKILRLVQEGQYNRVGRTDPVSLDARLVFATNRDLKAEVTAGRFREDLYYRLANFVVELPPLRKRVEDIPLLAHYFLRKYSSQYSRSVLDLDPDALAALEEYSFPGNVRELEGMISSAVLLENSSHLTCESLPPFVLRPDPAEAEAGVSLEQVRLRAVMEAMAVCNGNQTRAAEKLGIARGTLNRMLREYRKNLSSQADE